MSTQWEREEDQIDRDYENGLIDLVEYKKQIRDLRNDYMDAAREAAQNAYDREIESW